MTTKIRKLSVKMSIALAMLLFACSGGNRQSQTNSQNEKTSPVKTSDSQIVQTSAISENEEAGEDKTANVQKSAESENEKANEKANENKSAVEETKTVSETKEKSTPKIMSYHQVEVQPLFDGKRWIPEFNKYFSENQKLRKISEEAGVKEEWNLFCMFFIDTDGAVIDVSVNFMENAKIVEEKMKDPSFQLLADEMTRLINNTQGKWTPAIHKGEKMKVQIGIGQSFSRL